MMRSMTKKLADVAAFAGVSLATVRRVLNDKPGIAPATRAAVLTALDVFGLERPAQFRAERDGLVGLVVPDLQNPIFPAMVEAISIPLAKLGFMPVLCTRTADGVSEANYIQLLLRRDVAGIVFIGARYRWYCSTPRTRTAARPGSAWTTRRRPTRRWPTSPRWATGGSA
jgi:DNA-binding LacI/PurR family transcriptional regulator